MVKELFIFKTTLEKLYIVRQADLILNRKNAYRATSADSLLFDLYSQPSGDTITCFNTSSSTEYQAPMVSGDVFCYSISGETLNGGFYQGFYKLHGFDYQTLPDRYVDGLTIVIELKKGQYIDYCPNKFTLNEYNPDNAGFFFYHGLKSTDPYCGKEEQLTQCGTLSGLDVYTERTINPLLDESPFLYYTRTNLCDGSLSSTLYTYTPCDEGISNNAFGVRLTDDGRFNIRYFTTTGDCVGAKYVSQTTLMDVYTSIFIEDELPHQITLVFDPIKSSCPSDKYYEIGFSIYVDGYLKHQMLVPELRSIPLDVSKERQFGVPYNFSFGGGTVGNLENNFADADIIDDTICEYSFCVYSELGDLLAITKDGQTITNEYDTILGFLQSVFEEVKVVNNVYGKCEYDTYTVKTDGTFDMLHFVSNNIKPKQISCINIIANESSTILGDNFGGTFMGDLCGAYIYGKKLLLQDIRDLYEAFKIEKSLNNDICC